MTSNLEQEAETARIMVEAEGGKAFVLIASVKGDMIAMTRGISEGTTKRDGLAWIQALERERERVAKLIGVVL